MFSLPNRHDREIFALALPALGSLAIDPLVSLVDTAFVGRLGTAELGALGVNAAIFALAFLVFNFLAYGTTPQIGRAVGSGDADAAGRIAINGLALGALIGLIVTFALLLFSAPILSAMGATGDLGEPATTYLHIRAFAGPAVLVIIAANGAFRGYQDTRTPLWVALIFNAINIILTPVLIFGAGWGIAGAAIATVVAQWTGALIFCWLLLVKYRQRFGIPLIAPRVRAMLPLIQIGGALVLRTTALVSTMSLATAVAARMGVVEVAAHQVAYQLWGFLALVVDALAVAGQALLAKYIGDQSPDTARAIGNRLLQWGVAVGLLLALLFWLGRPYLPHLFTDDSQTISMVLTIFIFVAVMQPINGLVFVLDGLFMGAEAFRVLAITMLLSAAVGAGLLLAALHFQWGLIGVWFAITAMMLVRLLTLGLPWLTSRVPGLSTPP